jgi:hypothetical protein
MTPSLGLHHGFLPLAGVQVKPPRSFKLLESRIGLLRDQPDQSDSLGGIEGGLPSPAVRFGSKRADLPSSLGQPSYARAADPKPPGDLTLRLVLIDRRGQWLSAVHRIGSHDNVLLSQDFQLK